MFYVYILQSEKDKQFYVGYSKDLKARINEHNNGKVQSTKNRMPLQLVYYEACINQKDATHREKYLKTSWGKRYIKNRLKNYLTGWNDLELIFTMLGERVTTEISQKEKPQTFDKNKNVARRGGKVAGIARKETEKELGRSVTSKQNFLAKGDKPKLED